MSIFRDKLPTVHWVQCMAAKHSPVVMQLIRALALCMQLQHSSPLTPLHIARKWNAMTNIPSITPFQFISATQPGLLDCLSPFLLNRRYKTDFNFTDEAFNRRQVVDNTNGRNKYWSYWHAYVASLAVYPYLQGTIYKHRMRALIKVAIRVQTGSFGRGQHWS